MMFENDKMEQETWSESVERFRKVFTFTIERVKEIELEGYGSFEFSKPESIESLQALEVYIGFSIPNSLKDFWLTQGSLRIGTRGHRTAFEVYCVRNGQSMTFKKFWELIDVELTSLLGEFLSISEIAELNQNYFVFGEIFLGDSNREYLYFTKYGSFGTLVIYHDDDSGLIGLRQMIAGKGNFFTSLDELFSYCMNLKIDRIYEWMKDHDAL